MDILHENLINVDNITTKQWIEIVKDRFCEQQSIPPNQVQVVQVDTSY